METTANLQLFDELYTALLPWIIIRARRLAHGDRDLQDDLLQIGLQTLWELCAPTVTTLDTELVRADIYRTMVIYRGEERRAGLIPLAIIGQRRYFVGSSAKSSGACPNSCGSGAN